MRKPCSATDPLWYKDAVIYEIHVRAFCDSNADGIGDFPGLISKLDYLQDLGVTCLWLLPFFPSPLRDDGYDIADYTGVNPAYGTLDDFRQFLAEAHARNLQVMIELVINHTSDQHPWFQRARHAPKGSPDRNMYVWSDTDKLYDGVRIIFTDTEKSNWTWDEVAQQYYWHRFFSHQPDLNFDNPRVMEEVLNAMRFWMDMGVDGLRLDAIPYLVERDGTSCENVPETHLLIKHIRSVMDAEYENRLILAEANMWPADVRPYFGDGDECQMAFHFPLMPRIYMALRQEDRLPITDIMAQTPAIPSNCQWGLFLRNHDELTLEMVTDDERDYMYLAYSADPRMRINVGIRRRLAPLVDNNRRRIELLNSLLLSFPGTPILYYGDEIGMGDNIYLGDRNGVRTPMQWNSDRNAGFSRALPAQLYFPVIMDPIWGYQAINVEAQQADASSLLHWNRNMIALRKLFQVFGRGSLEFLHPENRKVLAYIREYTREEADPSADGVAETVLCIANLSRFAQPAQLDLARFAGYQPFEMLGYVPFPAIDHTPYAVTLAPYSFLWLELQPAPARPVAPTLEPLATVMNASAMNPEPAAAVAAPPSLAPYLTGEGLALLESLLPAYIAPRRWFGAKSRPIRAARVLSSTPLGDAALLLVEVLFAAQDNAAAPNEASSAGAVALSGAVALGGAAALGVDDLYQLPLALAPETDPTLAAIREHTPQAILATLSHTSPPVVLYDATSSPGFQAALLQAITTGPGAPRLDSETADQPPASPAQASPAQAAPALVATRSAALDPAALTGQPSRLSSVEQSNTSIFYGERAILKLYRHLRPGQNPDVEIGRFLTDVAHFPAIPAYLGDLATADGATLAFLQAFAPNQGDGWAWTLDELGRFYEAVASLPAPAHAETPAFSIDAAPSTALPPALRENAGLYLDAAHLLGRRTAELHLALTTPTDDPALAAAFAPEPFNAISLAEERERIDRNAATTFNALQTALDSAASGLTPEGIELSRRLLERREALIACIQALQGDPQTFGLRIRIHGDYHLGQVLRSKTDFLLVDFEGEPARPLAERRRKQSPLRDVAGMLRSFSYAARTGLDRYVQRHPDCRAALEPWAAAWEQAAVAAFLRGYTEAAAAQPGLLPAPPQAQLLCKSLLLEKAAYELLYELNNRPAWLPTPLRGLLSLVEPT